MVNRKRRVARVGEEIGNPAALIVEAVDTSIPSSRQGAKIMPICFPTRPVG